MSGNRASGNMKRPTGRSARSSNWRAKENQNPGQAVEPTHREQSSRLGAFDDNQHIPPEPAGPLNDTANKNRADSATQDGRRLHLGNVPQRAKEDDVRAFFADSKYVVEQIIMNINPRNPTYCFVDLQTKEQADEAIRNLNGLRIWARQVKIGPGLPPRSSQVASSARGSSTSSSRGGYRGEALDRWQRNGAADSSKGYDKNGRRLFVGGIPLTITQRDVDIKVQELFQGYKFGWVNTPIIPHKDPEKQARDHRFVFVDLATAEEAERAAKELNGSQSWGVKIRVERARQSS